MTPNEAIQFLDKIEDYLLERAKKGIVNFGDRTVGVKIIHDDGSYMMLNYCLVLQHEGYWFILSEHLGSHWFSEDEVEVQIYDGMSHRNNTDILEQFLEPS